MIFSLMLIFFGLINICDCWSPGFYTHGQPYIAGFYGSMICSIRGWPPRGTRNSIVKDGNRPLTLDGVLIDEQLKNRSGVYMVDGFDTLAFDELNRTVDSGYYECCAYDGDPRANTTSQLKCSGWMIEIHGEVPLSIYPQCTTYVYNWERRIWKKNTIASASDTVNVWVNPRVNPSEYVYLNCLSKDAYPSEVNLQWSNDNPTNSTAYTDEYKHRDGRPGSSRHGPEFRVMSNLTFTVRDTYVNDVYTCNASNLNFSRQCSISVNILKPSIHVTVSPNDTAVDQNNTVTFSCNSPYLAAADTLEWNSEPPIDSSRRIATSGNFTIRNVSGIDNQTTISCFVLHNNQWLYASAVLFVRQTELVSTTSEAPIVLILNSTDINGRSSGSSITEGLKFLFLLGFIGLLAAVQL